MCCKPLPVILSILKVNRFLEELCTLQLLIQDLRKLLDHTLSVEGECQKAPTR